MNEPGGLTLPGNKTYYKAAIIKKCGTKKITDM